MLLKKQYLLHLFGYKFNGLACILNAELYVLQMFHHQMRKYVLQIYNN